MLCRNSQGSFTTRSPPADAVPFVSSGSRHDVDPGTAVAVWFVGVLPNQSSLLITHRLKGVVAKRVLNVGHETLGQIAAALI